MSSEYQPGLTLITCTGGRPQAFELCARFIGRRTYAGPFQWIIVDDVGDSPASHWIDDQVENGRVVTAVTPEPKWRPGQNTLARNLLAAIPHVRYDKVLFIEDDDFYPPDYCAMQCERLDSVAWISGDPMSRYYHVPSRRFRFMVNEGCASLCQTGLRSEYLLVLENVLSSGSHFIDRDLWLAMARSRRDLSMAPHPVVGMKGLPGRAGIGIGHRPEMQPLQWSADPDGRVLREWIGEDAELYEQFYATYPNNEPARV